MAKAQRLPAKSKIAPSVITFGVCAACDPRIDTQSRDRTVNIVETIADLIASRVKMPNGTSPTTVAISLGKSTLADSTPVTLPSAVSIGSRSYHTTCHRS